jgi:hypothetical protein
MSVSRRFSVALVPALMLAGGLAGVAPSRAEAAPFYYRWEPSFHERWYPPRHRPRKRAQQETRTHPVAPGPLLITVSIAQQEAKIFSGSTEVARTRISTGVPGHPTPTGVFAVIQKQVYHESNLYSAAPMPHMQRLTWSGIALHGGVVPGHPASHGCIRLPHEFATKLYSMTKLGTRVVVSYGETAPIEIAHKALLQPSDARPAADPKTAALDIDTVSKMTDQPRTDVTSSIRPALPEAPKEPVTKRQRGALSVFISRKQQKLYVRRNFEPLFDAPIAILSPDKPIGTHVFTATEQIEDKGLRWSAVSIPSAQPKRAHVHEAAREKRKAAAPVQVDAGPAASSALERIDIPQEVRERLAGMLTPGASLIVSDNALSDETGEDTDFVVLTP